MKLSYSLFMTSKKKIEELLIPARITLNGKNPWDIQVYDDRLYDRVFAQGALGFGEAYMDGWWDAEDLAEFFYRFLRPGLADKVQNFGAMWYFLRAFFTNMQNKNRAFQVGEEHYDVGNDLYKRMLDQHMVYSCGYWSGTPEAKSLAEAQEAKMDLICKKLGLKPGQTILDIGCGWGGFLQFAHERYGTQGVGTTVSKEQAELASERVRGLPIDIRFEDYRNTVGKFDHIISIGMFEHVGPKNYRAYFTKARELLKDDGLFLLHTIGSRKKTQITDPWINRYIFPNGVLPSVEYIGKGADRLFTVEDWHNFGPDYDPTLLAWCKNFERAWPKLKTNYSERFYRLWRYYLLSTAGGFRARHMHLWQILLSKKGVEGGYKSVR